jgi:glycosyltransferase involved in cell wall biosynthesis
LVYHLHNEKLDTKVPHYQEIYNTAWRILTVSNYIKSRVQTINSKDTKTITIYNGIDLKAFSQGTPINKDSIGLSNDNFLLVFSGRVNREKGIMELIKAMNQLASYPNIKLLVIGSSFYGNADNENDFARLLKQNAEPLKDRIIFTGFIPYSDMPNFLSMSDVAVIPSVWDDPFPTTVLEAQAMGLPIITTRRGGIPEEVTEENAIILSTDKNFVKNLTNAIIDLYEHPEKRKQMAAASLERSKLFDKETYVQNFFKALESI